MAIKAKIYGELYNHSSSIAFDETSTYLSAPNAPNFSAFHLSPHVSLVSTGQHFVTMRVVITESDRRGPYHRIRPGCAGRA